MRALWLGFALFALAAEPASAACRCVCVNGEVRTLCSGPLDAPAICSRICPASVRPPGAPPVTSGLVRSGGAEETLATGSPALFGATGSPER
ncbi:hypothetical protein [uncultured Methylobacterium sp.]|uniref:hypothetical protein n=1 Tax=uncultured Methylobacterium sp. TaxID=157278 RepID=UPI0035CC483D